MNDPGKITPLEWAIEKTRWQNPRIRALLGSVRGLDDVLESNFAILHCSPARLLEIWDTVRTVCWVMRTEVTPLMEQPSMLPELDDAIQNARDTLSLLEAEIFAELDCFSQHPEENQFDELRKTLCINIGKLHGFLVDTLGEILAADPRSRHDVDYFLDRKFPRDVEEAEWLQTSVTQFYEEVAKLNARRHEDLGSVIDMMSRSGQLPPSEVWERLTAFLNAIEANVAPKLKTLAGLRAIRISELELLQIHATDLPESCRVAAELQATASAVLDKLDVSVNGELSQSSKEIAADVERVLCVRITTCLRVVEDELRDLAAFVPLWMNNIEKRRALMLRSKEDEIDIAGPEDAP